MFQIAINRDLINPKEMGFETLKLVSHFHFPLSQARFDVLIAPTKAN